MPKIYSLRNAILIILLAASGLKAQELDYKGFPEWSWHKQDSTEYYLYTPSNLKKGERYPIALFLHGCCGKSYQATLRNAVDPPVRMWHHFGKNTQSIPTYIVSPATSRGWRQHIENLKKVIDDLVENHQGDVRRIYITGFSMGGDGTIAFIEKYPAYFAAALPMGMDFRADLTRIKDVPIWTNKGETDWFSRSLNKSVAEIRALNGDPFDSSANHVTGVNPRFTEFKGVGHGVQWVAASTQNLTGWAYSKVNDGNKYPVVFFKTPSYQLRVKENSTLNLVVEARDPDGVINRIDVYVNGKLIKKLTTMPYATSVVVGKGDSKIEAIAFDDKGKSSIATTLVSVNVPARVTTTQIPEGIQGGYYSIQLQAEGNGKTTFSSGNETPLPDGLKLLSHGLIKGVPERAGNYKILVNATDEDGDKAAVDLSLRIVKKNPSEVVVTDARNYAGKKFNISKVMLGESVHGDRGDDEVTLSSISRFNGLTLIQTDVNDTINARPYYMEFSVDEDVTVFIAYEKTDNLYHSSIPDWLTEFRKEKADQLVTQYFYYDIYSKDFSKGKIVLPDAEEKKNGVNTNYFVMVGRRR